ncbi:MAG: DNA-3-methyladenine glycosylase 2 family protein [Saprospiraceae bacterium]|nr:DNA-3-methyladenine glycosylase 2 family protein [Saprospiraceae bacterium]
MHFCYLARMMAKEDIIAHLTKDARLKVVIDSTEMHNWTGGGSVYADLLGSIISQQISVRAAATIQERFLNLFENGYPHVEQVLAFDEEKLRSVGLSRQKASYIRNIAEFFKQENLIDYDWSPHQDDEIIKLLTQIKGVGQWTVEMILMFTLNRPDILPLDDLGIRQAMIKLYSVAESGRSLKPRLMEIAESWRPYRTYACRYLWKWKDQ